MATITFNDGSGSQTIDSAWAFPANRFNNWTPKPAKIGERRHAVGDGTRYQWSHRTDYGASFQLDGIANSSTNQDKLQDFKLWADAGGTFTVTTTDSSSNVYTTCGMAPGAVVEIVPDRKRKSLSLVLDVINLAGAQMICAY